MQQWQRLGHVILAISLLSACGKGVGGSAASKQGVVKVDKLAAATTPLEAKSAVVVSSQTARSAEIDMRFKQAAAMLHIKQYQYAATALQRVLELAPKLPEAHVNMGYAMLGMGRHVEALDFFNEAIKLKADQANAYYGLALASYNTGEITAAIEALNRFIQLSRPDDPYQDKARAVLLEWRHSTYHKLGGRTQKQKSGFKGTGELSVSEMKKDQ